MERIILSLLLVLSLLLSCLPYGSLTVLAAEESEEAESRILEEMEADLSLQAPVYTEDPGYAYSAQDGLHSRSGEEVSASGTLDSLTWTFYGASGELVISGDRNMTGYYQPDKFPWYSFRKDIRSVTIEDGVGSVGNNAFYDCSALTRVSLPKTISYIKDYAFYGCSALTSIDLPHRVLSIGSYAFYGCSSLKSISIPHGVNFISDFAFCNCSGLTSIDLPDDLYRIDASAFRGCSGLTSITIPDSVGTISGCAFYECTGLTSITLPDIVKTISNSTFFGCSGLTSITLPDSVRFIESYAFGGCSGLTSITLPDSVESIDKAAFSNCSGLTSITIPDGMTYIYYSVFSGCSGLTSVTFPDSVTRIHDSAFSGCNGLTSITIPDSVTYIGSYAFHDCDELTSITIPDSVTFIDEYAFYSCDKLRHVHFIGNMPYIGYSAYSSCSSELELCYLEGTEGWEKCKYPAVVWDYTHILACLSISYICNSCGNGYSYENDAHRWNDGEEVAPLCTDEGRIIYTCLECGNTKVEMIPPTGHKRGSLISATETYWVYSCLNGDHIYIEYKDPRMCAMFLTGVRASFTDSDDHLWVSSENDSATGCNSIKTSDTSRTTVTFTSDRDFTLSFDYMVSTNISLDVLTIQLDGITVADQITGSVTQSYDAGILTAGTHTLTLSLFRDYSFDVDPPVCYIYNIVAKAVSSGCAHAAATMVERKEATCMEPGNIAYWYCPDCQIYCIDQALTTEIFAETTVIPAAGHNYVEGICPCGAKEVLTDETVVIHHSLSLANDITLNYAVAKAQLSSYDSFYLECSVPVYVGGGKMENRSRVILPVLDGSYYYFPLTGLSAVQMNDILDARICMTKGDREYVSMVDSYSIATYAYSQLDRATASDALKTLCADLLRYGAKAQVFKNYRTEDLADAKMTHAHKAYLSNIDAVQFGKTNKVLPDLDNASIAWVGKSLTLDSKVCLNFVFSMGTYTGDVSDLTLHVSYTDIKGETKESVLTNAKLYSADMKYYVFTLDTMLASELRSVVDLQVYSGNTPVSCTLQYSADTYGNNKTGDLLELCKALFAYSDSARSYFAG